MDINKNVYRWTKRDKLYYFIILIPFLVGFIGAAIILATISIYLTFFLILLYIIANIFQAGCCVGCPYRGRYCPALCGVFLANFLSAVFYKNRKYNEKFFKINASFAEIFVLLIFIYCAVFLFFVHIFYTVAFLTLAILHFILFFSILCPKCSYNETCPGGQTSCKIFKKRCEKYKIHKVN